MICLLWKDIPTSGNKNFLWRELSMPAPNEGTLSIFFGWLLNGYLWKHSLEQRQSMSLQNVKKPQASIKNHLSVLVSQGKASGCQWRKIRRCELDPWVGIWKMPWRRKWQPTAVFLQLNRHIVFLSFIYFSSLSFSLSLSSSLCTPFFSLSFSLPSFLPFPFIFLLYLTLMEFTELS